ncbi:hypothetical protein BU14_0161s0036 [Porphyra umbilicalis]|uniref:Uncharacterized protein n=1 Tax=Porphyra umbilicalis TaxID=2786 RepID=A0A1X6P8H8_PORUM|nr:hypothetical protein BU14_0161s0036 [Porphyra umbilicalis]|eukprot:OSX77117.1 hypothetical protein BU14_0161s0036 [Porphyra umbilicalis]
MPASPVVPGRFRVRAARPPPPTASALPRPPAAAPQAVATAILSAGACAPAAAAPHHASRAPRREGWAGAARALPACHLLPPPPLPIGRACARVTLARRRPARAPRPTTEGRAPPRLRVGGPRAPRPPWRPRAARRLCRPHRRDGRPAGGGWRVAAAAAAQTGGRTRGGRADWGGTPEGCAPARGRSTPAGT